MILRRHLRADRHAGDCLLPDRRYLILTIRFAQVRAWAHLSVCDHDGKSEGVIAPLADIQCIYRQICEGHRWSIHTIRKLIGSQKW